MDDDDQIQVITWQDAVRRRPAMYLGSTGPLGLMFLAREVFECPREPTHLSATLSGPRLHVAARCTPISVRPREEGKPIYLLELLSGIWIPLDRPPSIAAMEILDTDARPATFRRVQQGPSQSALAIANAVSATMTVTSRSHGVATSVEFSRGVLASGPDARTSAEPDGVDIDILPDEEIFRDASFRFETLAEMLRDHSLRRQVPIELRDTERDLLFVAGAG